MKGDFLCCLKRVRYIHNCDKNVSNVTTENVESCKTDDTEVAYEILKEKVKNDNIPENIRKRLNIEIKRYESTPITSGEIGMIKSYIYEREMEVVEMLQKEQDDIKEYLNNEMAQALEMAKDTLAFIRSNRRKDRIEDIKAEIATAGIERKKELYALLDKLLKEQEEQQEADHQEQLQMLLEKIHPPSWRMLHR